MKKLTRLGNSILGIMIVFLLFSSCSQRIVDFTIISSKNVPITNKGTNFQKANNRVKGVDSKLCILFIPGTPNMKEAIDRAIEKYPGAVALTDGVIYNKAWSCLLFGQNKYIVEGTPLYPTTVEEEFIEEKEKILKKRPSTIKETNALHITHKVEQGETLASIAAIYKVSVPEIIRWNELTTNSINKGMQLSIYIKQ